jgi:hypothetical protein
MKSHARRGGAIPQLPVLVEELRICFVLCIGLLCRNIYFQPRDSDFGDRGTPPGSYLGVTVDDRILSVNDATRCRSRHFLSNSHIWQGRSLNFEVWRRSWRTKAPARRCDDGKVAEQSCNTGLISTAAMGSDRRCRM